MRNFRTRLNGLAERPRLGPVGLLGAAALLLSLAAAISQSTLAQDNPTTAPAAIHGQAAESPSVPRSEDESSLVYVIPVEGEFENALHLIMVRAVREAERKGADAIVLDMDTPGGRVDSAIKIRDLLIETDIKTYTYVNPMAISAGAFIAVATDTIIMGENGSIGGALPITIDAEGAQGADEKMLSIFAAEMRKTAKTKGHPVDIVSGFCDPDVEIPGLKEKGEILTLDYEEATSVGLARYQTLTLDEMLEREGLTNATVKRFSLTRTDRVARFLSNSVVLGILMMLGVGGIFLEIKTPGIGLPGLIGITAIGLYFFGSYLANLSSFIEWIFFALGVLLLVLEVYVTPGFGVLGVSGIALIFGSLFFALTNLAPDGFTVNFSGARLSTLKMPVYTIGISTLALIPLLYVLSKLLPSMPMFKGLVLLPENSTGETAPAPAETGVSGAAIVKRGDRGVTVTGLYPTGVARFAERRIDVLTEGEFIEKSTPVVVLRVEGSRVFVAQAGE